jgi:hypothetical protein
VPAPAVAAQRGVELDAVALGLGTAGDEADTIPVVGSVPIAPYLKWSSIESAACGRAGSIALAAPTKATSAAAINRQARRR